MNGADAVTGDTADDAGGGFIAVSRMSVTSNRPSRPGISTRCVSGMGFCARPGASETMAQSQA